MDSDATVRDDGHMDATTRTRTGTCLGGFTGSVQLIFFGDGDSAMGNSPVHTFGLAGTKSGRSDMEPAGTAQVARLVS